MVIAGGIIKKKKIKSSFVNKEEETGRLFPSPQPTFEEREQYKIK